MAYDEALAQRMRRGLAPEAGLSEKRMFGGVSFLVNGNMACGLTPDGLVVRVGPVEYEGALSRPEARPMDFTGRSLKGWVYVSAEGYREDAHLDEWLARGVAYARTLPAK